MHPLALQPDAWDSLVEPVTRHAPLLALGGLLLGLVILLAGAKLVRGGLVLVGLAAGGFLGYLLSPSIFTTPDIGGLSVNVIGAGLGAIGGGLLAAVLFRFAATAASAAGAAVLGVLAASVWFGFARHDVLVPSATSGPAAQAWAQAAASAVSTRLADPASTPLPLTQQLWLGVQGVAEATILLAQSLWLGATEEARRYIALGGAAGILVGLALGVVSPKRAMGLTTALAGAGLCVGCAAVLGPQLGIDTATPGADRFALWAFVALLVFGVGVQWASMRKTKSAPRPALPAA